MIYSLPMSVDKEPSPSSEQCLINQLPEMANELNTFWSRFSRAIGFSGGWSHFTRPDEITPRDMAINWAGEVQSLTASCAVETLRPNLQTTLVLLKDLSEELRVYLGPFWEKLPEEDQATITVRMDFFAQSLLDIFKRRGYISDPFELK